MRNRSIIGPIALVAIGVLFLLNNLELHLDLREIIGDYWPLLIIAAGVLRLVERLNTPLMPGSKTMLRAITGPVMAITVGSLLMLDRSDKVSFHYTWPALLIVLGLLRLFEKLEGTPTAFNS